MNPARMPEPAASWAVDFTSETGMQCQRPTCGKMVTAMKDLHYMLDLRKRDSGRYLCKECYDHYLSKSTSQRTATRLRPPSQQPPAAPAAPLSVTHQVNIQRDIAAAQRGRRYFSCPSDPCANSF